jgi:hypothetical protein
VIILSRIRNKRAITKPVMIIIIAKQTALKKKIAQRQRRKMKKIRIKKINLLKIRI